MNLKVRAAGSGVSYATAGRCYESGTLPVATYRLGRLVMVGVPVTDTRSGAGRAVAYAGVSSADQKANLDRQVAGVSVWAGWTARCGVAGGDGGWLRGRRASEEIFGVAAVIRRCR